MNALLHRRQWLHSGLALGLSIATGGARACEYFSPTLRVFHPWTRASAPGDTRAVISLKFDDVSQTDRLIGAETPVARAVQLGGPGFGPGVDFVIAAGSESVFSEAGPHLLLQGLNFPLEVGRSYPLTLRFEKGGIVDATLNVDYARFA